MNSDDTNRPPQSGHGGAQRPPDVDPVRLQHLTRELRDNQNLALGALAGLVAAAVGAVLWAMISWKTGYQIGFMAVGVGVLVGFANRFAGRGIDTIFGITGGALALLGCVTGNLLTGAIAIAQANDTSIFDILSRLDITTAMRLLKLMFNPMDLIFYAFAAYEGYKLSFRKLTAADMARLQVPE